MLHHETGTCKTSAITSLFVVELSDITSADSIVFASSSARSSIYLLHVLVDSDAARWLLVGVTACQPVGPIRVTSDFTSSTMIGFMA